MQTERLAFLASAGEVLAASLDYEDTLNRLARVAIPILGDMCIVDIVEDGGLRRVTTAHIAPEKQGLLTTLRDRYPASEDSPQPAGRVLRTGAPELLAEVTPEVVASHSRDEEHARLVHAIGIRSHLAVPLTAGRRIVGVLSLGITESARQYGADDLVLAQDLARHAALAVENARLFRAAQAEIAERRRAEEALRVSEARFRAVLDQSPLSTQIVRADGVLVRVNPAWEALWGVTLDRIPEYNMLEDEQLERRGIAHLLRRAFAGEPVEIPAIPYDPNDTIPDRTRHADSLRWVRAFAYPIRDTHGQVQEVVLIQEDVTAARRAEEQLRRSEERLRLALAAARMNVWDWDLTTDRLECSDNAVEIWGIQVGEAADFLKVVHPDDLQTVHDAAQSAIAAGGSYESEYRLVSAGGQVRWVQSRGRTEKNAAGEVTRILGVTMDISELKAAEQRLRDDDRRKDEFLATLAHELRNPLAPIRTGLELLRVATSPHTAEYTRQVIERQLTHLVHLIDDLLDLSRVTRGKVQLQRERVDLFSIVATAVEATRPAIDAAGLELVLRLPDTPIAFEADRTRLAQVLSNLLHNAAKYTERGGRIEVSASVDGDDAEIRIRDTGIGIPHDMLDAIFEMFMQVERSLARSQGGLGIGLTLVRGFVELHGGRVWAESDGPGQGSTFVVRLPMMAPDAERQPAAAARSRASGTARRVLVVDDNVDAAETLATLLQLHGHDVHTAHHGATALELVVATRPEIVLLDIGLPGMSGYEVARRIRREPDLQVVLVAVTGWGQASDRQQSRDAGFDHHLTKPVDPQELLALLTR